MFRIFLFLEGRAVPYRYLDSVHAGIVNAFKAAGLTPDQIIGKDALPWTFATKGFAQKGGRLFLKGITISTCNSSIAEGLRRFRASDIRHVSTNGDQIDLAGARKTIIPDPILDGQHALPICFASPFVLSQPAASGDSRKSFAESLAGFDLSQAFSNGLTRRLRRPVTLEVHADRLSMAVDGKPRIVSLRRAPNRRVTIPAFSMRMTLRGPADDLRAAYFAGLGEKTRYGFGCAATLI
jgi:CRISPR/Cas system endoribonuclease Cas6 (RAMP superfamily)